MMDTDNVLARVDAQTRWARARRAAGIEGILNLFSGQPDHLLSFEEVQTKLNLKHKACRGLRDIPLRQIRGSVGRYRDFTRTFLPKREWMRDRWQHISAVATARGLPPIEVYQVGDAYFVLDGNHRVSAALQTGQDTIEAYVWEFDTIVGLSPEADLNDLIIKAEYIEFLNRTRLDTLRPEQHIIFTAPGRYKELEYQIELYRQALEYIDQKPTAYEDAVEAWYDMVYTPAVQIIKEKNALENFPGRTEADLFIWVWRHRNRLMKEGGRPELVHIIDDFIARSKPLNLKNLWQTITGRLRR